VACSGVKFALILFLFVTDAIRGMSGGSAERDVANRSYGTNDMNDIAIMI
jgi:hypothetical protein